MRILRMIIVPVPRFLNTPDPIFAVDGCAERLMVRCLEGLLRAFLSVLVRVGPCGSVCSGGQTSVPGI